MRCYVKYWPHFSSWAGGGLVAPVVEALRYRKEDRGFDSRWVMALGSTQRLTEMSNRGRGLTT
jgi:hypothetical protein